jgi:hypothetical protein
MNTRPYRSIVFSAGFALALVAPGGIAGADEASAPRAAHALASAATVQETGQERIAATTQKLESAFNEQFVRGKIDRAALSGAIDDVVEAMPEAARPKVKDHIELVLQHGERLAAQLTPEQRAEAAAPPAPEKIGKTQQAQVTGWGWPGYGGWGGYGAFGFPAMYNLGYGYASPYLGYGGLGYGGLGYGGLGYGGFGYGTSFSTYSAYSSSSAYSSGCGLGWGALGCGGWYW